MADSSIKRIRYWIWSSHQATLIKADNQGAIALTKDPSFHPRTKHIGVQWHFVRDQVETGTVQFEWIPTRDMAADGLTKALSNEKVSTFIPQLGLKAGQ